MRLRCWAVETGFGITMSEGATYEGTMLTVSNRPTCIRYRNVAFLALALPLMNVSLTADQGQGGSTISCKRHIGDFSNDFSPDFDISSVDCRTSLIKHSPTVRFWAVPPYVGY